MTAGSGRVIGIRLPEDHPIFLIEAGKRSEVARSWLDSGDRLERMEGQIERILAILEVNPPNLDDRSPKSKQEDKNDFNKDSFLSYFE